MESNKEEAIKILSYNILAQSLICDSLHITEEQVKNTDYLKDDYRINKIFEIIDNLHPDICLFQEYEHNKKFEKKFKSDNYAYEILYKKRPGVHKEGCAIAYDTKKFHLDYYCALELRLEEKKNSYNNKYDYNNKNYYYTKKKNQSSNIYNKENVALFIFLHSYETNYYYLIICSHLLFNHTRGDIKLAQIYQIMQCALLFKDYYKDYHITTIFGGDLNSTPNSAIYEYITSKSIDVEYMNKANLSGQKNKNYKTDVSFADINYSWYNEIINTYPKFKNNLIILKNKKNKKYYDYDYDKKKGLILENNFAMKSFYKEKNGKEPDMTSYTSDFKGTVDFLFYNTDLNLTINSVQDFPNISSDIPDKDNPSDHLPLFVEFNIKE